MNVDFIYRLILSIIRKNQQGGLKPADFNLFINQAQKEYQSWLLGLPQQYVQGRPTARVELGNNSIIRQRLSPVIIPDYAVTINSGGKSVYPTGYLQTDAMFTSSMGRVTFVDQNALYSYLDSSIDPIITFPIYLLEDTGFQFYPKSLGNAILSYVGEAPDIVWGYIPDSNGRPIYNVPTSTNPVWDTPACIDIIGRTLRMIGVNLQDAAISQYATEIKNTGA